MSSTKYAYDPGYAMCRSVTGHVWNLDPGALPKSSTLPGFGWRFECSTCATTKDVWYNRRTGEVIARRYSYPDDYRTGIERTEIRLHALKALDPVRAEARKRAAA